jgi:hypothetical protein
MTAFERTERNRVRRLPERGKYDPATIYPIIDEALICHVGFVQDGQPFVIPTLHARDGDCLLLHGATTSRLLKHVQAGHEVCASITLVDGLVLARSVFHHSINYRSVVLFGTGQLVEGDEAKLQALERFTERLLPGRWADARPPNPTELKATSVVSIPMTSASAKVRVGPPGDDDEDLALPIWAGVLPMQPVVGTPLAAPNLDVSIALPDYIREYVRQREG